MKAPLFHQFRSDFARHELVPIELAKALTKLAIVIGPTVALSYALIPWDGWRPWLPVLLIVLGPAAVFALYRSWRAWSLLQEYFAGRDR
jgi:hypothetical protein